MSEWTEVKDENENAETEFEGKIWKPEMVDEAIIGRYVDMEENVGTNNDSTLYHIRDQKDELWKVWGSKVLDSLFQKVPLQSEVKLVYLGKKQSKAGFYYKVYKLFQKPGGGASSSSSSTVEKPESDEPPVINMMSNDEIEDNPFMNNPEHDAEARALITEITDFLLKNEITPDQVGKKIIGSTASKWVRQGKIKSKTMLERIEKELDRRY